PEGLLSGPSRSGWCPRKFTVAVECSATQGRTKQGCYVLVYRSSLVASRTLIVHAKRFQSEESATVAHLKANDRQLAARTNASLSCSAGPDPGAVVHYSRKPGRVRFGWRHTAARA